jgi:hypothetical protein
MRLDISSQRTLEEPQDLDQPISLYCPRHGIVNRVSGLREGSLARQFRSKGIFSIDKTYQIVSQDMFQKKMEGMSVILMLQVAEFMKEHIVLQDFRHTYDVQVKIYV